jgi:hypothetical protein
MGGEEPEQVRGGYCQREEIRGHAMTGSAVGGGEFRIVEVRGEGGGQFRGFAGGDEGTGAAWGDHFRDPGEGRRDDGQSGRHGLHDDRGEDVHATCRFDDTGEGEDTGLREEPRDIRLGERSGEGDLAGEAG